MSVLVTDEDVTLHAAQRLRRILRRQYGLGPWTVAMVGVGVGDGADFLDHFDEGAEALQRAPSIGPARSEKMIRAYAAYGGREGLLATSRWRLTVRMWLLRVGTVVGVGAWAVGATGLIEAGAPWWVALGWPVGCCGAGVVLVGWAAWRWI